MNKRKTTTWMALVIGLSLFGLVLVQYFLLRRASDLEKRLFDQTVYNALHRIVSRLETNEATRTVHAMTWSAKPSFHHEQEVITQCVNNQDSTKTINVTMQITDDSMPHVELVNQDLKLLLKKPEHVIIKTLDSTGQAQHALLMDDRKPAGVYHIKVPHRRPLRVSMISDSGSVVVQVINDKKDSLVVPVTFMKEKRKLVNRVLEELVYIQEKTVLQRINMAALDSIISLTLVESGLPSSVNYGIVDVTRDSVLFSQPPRLGRKIISSCFRMPLFPNDMQLSKSELCLCFPVQQMMRTRPMLPFLLASVCFLLLLIISFYYIVTTLANQKAFSSRLIDFINNMTHEFKTPITTISLAGETMQKAIAKADTGRLTQYSRIILDESRRMRSQVEKILQMAALEQGDVELRREEVNMHLIVEQAIKNFSLLMENVNGTCDFFPQAGETVVRGDMVHLQNIVHNLLDNAVKYTEQSPRIVIRSRNCDSGIEITVQDNGIGLTNQEQERIFEKFYRVNTGNVHNVKGFGIGLCYVRMMLMAHEGRINVSSAPGQGSCFTFWLPVIRNG